MLKVDANKWVLNDFKINLSDNGIQKKKFFLYKYVIALDKN
jgi:hypothetical protein